MNSKMTFAATSLLLAGVLAVTYGCASSADDGEGGGGSGGGDSSSSSSGGGEGGSGGGEGGSGGGEGDEDGFSFKGGQASGLFSGYGWVALGKDDTLTSPTCDEAEDPITNEEPCNTKTTWAEGGDGKLCMTGSIPALPSSPVQADYDNNWGVQIGVNATEPPDEAGDKMSDYKTVTLTFSGAPKSGLRAMVHRKGDGDATTYCLDSIKSGVALDLAKFNTKCWGETPTVKFSVPDDLPKIDKIGLQVSSSSSKIDVDLCLEKVEFGK